MNREIDNIQMYLKDQIHRRIKEERRIKILRQMAKETSKIRLKNTERYKLEDLKKRVRAIKEYSIKNMDELVKITLENLEKNDVHAFYAKNKSDVLKYFTEVCGDENFVARSAADVPLEVGLYAHLARQNVTVFNTDFGPMLSELLPGEVASNKAFPVIHLEPEVISKKLSATLGVPVKSDPTEIVHLARDYAIRTIEKAKTGITGANAISADGSVFLVHNLGNINRIISRLHRHVVIAGIEKIVPDFLDALNIVALQSMYLCGRMARHINIVSGPTRSIDVGNVLVKGVYGPEEVHVLLVDDWRSEAIRKGFQEALYCIRCFNCINFCPVYDRVSLLFSYLEKYPIPSKGAVTAAFCGSLKEAFKSGLFLCTLCGACKRACPLEIDTPTMVKRLRVMAAKKGLIPAAFINMEKTITDSGNAFGKKVKI